MLLPQCLLCKIDDNSLFSVRKSKKCVHLALSFKKSKAVARINAL